MMKLMRRKKRTWCYFGITIVFMLLGYLKYQSNMHGDRMVLNEAQSHWTPVTESIIHHSTDLGTDRLVHNSTQQTVASSSTYLTDKDTTIYRRADDIKENSSVSLLKYISNFEQPQLSLLRGVDKAVMITGAWNVVNRDIPLYKKAFELHNFTVIHDKNIFKVSLDKSWTALLCLSYSDMRDCFENLQFSNLKSFQKISHIPGIRSVLGKKDSLCQITSANNNIQLAPPCWVMPQQYEEFAGATTNLRSDRKIFFIKPVSSASDWRSRVINLEKPEDIEYTRRFQQHSGIIQRYFNNQLVISDRPFSIRTFVLVTSMSPLRAYMYNEGIVYFRTSQRKSHHRLSTKDPWCFAQLKEYLLNVRGPQAAEAVFRNIQLAIVQLLLKAEPHVAGYYGTIGGDPITGNLFRCLNCYQLLGIDLAINTSLHVMISEVNGQPNMKEAFQEDVPALNSIKEQLLYDMIGLVFNTDPVASNVTKIIDHLHVGLATVGCQDKQKHCLTDNDLQYLLSWHRELINLGNFKQLYPSADLSLFKSLFASSHVQDTNLRDTLLGHKAIVDRRHKSFHNAFELHDLILDFMKLSGSSQNSELKFVDTSSFQHVKLPFIPPKVDHPVQHQNEEYFGALIGNVLGGNKVSKSSCSNSLDQMPYLSELVVSLGRLQPTFTRQITNYKLVIPHEIPTVSISATPAHCSCVAKFSTDHMRMEIYNHVNWTFGIGNTTIYWLLLDSGHDQPWVINQYSITVTRQILSLYEPVFTMDQSHKVCALTQDCSLKVYPDRPCGLYELGDSTWENFKLQQSKKPDCKDGVDTGHWMLPCVHCTKPSTCFWREAVWTPKNCKHIRQNQNQSKRCTSNKKILFIGDSTCAGIMYYLIEKINGSLQDWTDSQTTITYENINNERTTFSFAYYPQFWLPKNQRAVYEETLDGLLKRNQPLSNDSSTVLIIGGVQWMNHHHIKVTNQLLNSVGLTRITVIVKGLSSGFYQPSTGIKWIPLEGQRRLVKLQESLSQITSQFGYNMIDTLGMTITRHKHFFDGNCACQFHKVVHSSSLDMKEPSDQDKESHDQRGYHVLGDINAVYSEIVMNIICKNITY